jgi:hypothetical protein
VAGNTHGGHNKALNETEDGALKQYLNFLIYIGKDPNLHTIQQAANSLLRAGGSTRILGQDWSKNWFSRNQKWYKSLRTKTPAAEQKTSHLTATIESHFSDFRNSQIKYGIAQDNIYNMGETGFRIGCLGSQIVITHLNTRAVYLSDPDNRKMVTSIECISGGGFAIAPMIILAGSVLIEKLFDNHINDDFLFSISDSGYINSYLYIEWL